MEENGMIVKHQTIQDIVCSMIRARILSGEIPAGQWIRQDELAGKLGVSRMPVREALRKLETEGLVTFYPHRGAMVTSITLEEFDEIYRIREELELLAVRWAGEHMAEFDLPRLRELFASIQDAEDRGDIEQRMRTVREFHFTILRMARRAHLFRIIEGLWDLTELHRRIYSGIQSVTQERLQVYADILEACEAHDPQALECAYRENYAAVRRILIPYIQARLNVSSTGDNGNQEAPMPTSV
jgi:DNA-binding GntR family transcriptional regulator